MSGILKPIDRKYISGYRRLGNGEWGVTAGGYEVSFRGEENVLELDSED